MEPSNGHPSSLGRLEKVDPRAVWATEAGHFTPWLAREDNLALLGDTIGFELELEAQEKNVGPFRADILCKDTVTESWVLIENQLERTDHTHLGQLITYAAGLKAVTIVWVATPFTEEHRAALDWLNEITDDRFNFFGLEVELWRIGESRVAPKFNVVCKPNDWARTVAAAAGRVEAGDLTDAKELQLRYWTAFRAFVDGRESRVRPTKPLPQHWMNLALGRSGTKMSAIASSWNTETESYDVGELRAEVETHGALSKVFFEQLHDEKEEVEAELGYGLTWYNPPDKRVCRAYVRRTADLTDESDWPAQHAWLLARLDELHRAFQPRVRSLSTDAAPPV